MKCDECLNLLEGYIDGELTERESEQVQSHLLTCTSCEKQLETLNAEGDFYARYDRDLEVSPALWNGIAARIAAGDREAAPEHKFSLGDWLGTLFGAPAFRFAMPAAALAALALIVGIAFWRTRPEPQPVKPVLVAESNGSTPTPAATESNRESVPTPIKETAGQRAPSTSVTRTALKTKPSVADQSGVLFNDAAFTEMEERDTASHLEQAQNLLTSFRNIKFADDDDEVDVSYERAESRRLLTENIVLRRDAENSGKFPTKSLLGSLEPFLIDIANLPDKAKPSEVRQITDRVQRTEIVAELRSY